MSPRRKADPVLKLDPPAMPLKPCPACGRLVLITQTAQRMRITLDVTAHAYRLEDGVAVPVSDVFPPHFVTCTERKEPRRGERRVT